MQIRRLLRSFPWRMLLFANHKPEDAHEPAQFRQDCAAAKIACEFSQLHERVPTKARHRTPKETFEKSSSAVEKRDNSTCMRLHLRISTIADTACQRVRQERSWQTYKLPASTNSPAMIPMKELRIWVIRLRIGSGHGSK